MKVKIVGFSKIMHLHFTISFESQNGQLLASTIAFMNKNGFPFVFPTTDELRTKVSTFIVVTDRPKGWKWWVRVMVDFVGVGDPEALESLALYISSAALSLILHPKAKLHKDRSSHSHNHQYYSTQELNILL